MRLILGALALPALAACDSGIEERAEVSSTRVVMRPHRPVPPGSAPRGAGATAATLAAGPVVTPAFLARGREAFLAFCAPCHGERGHGDGAVVSRGFPPPPSYHQERLREAPPEDVVAVATHGRGRMYPYADRILPEDRWAIAHYVKALQAEERSSGPSPSLRPGR